MFPPVNTSIAAPCPPTPIPAQNHFASCRTRHLLILEAAGFRESVISRGTALKGGMKTVCVDFKLARVPTAWTTLVRRHPASLGQRPQRYPCPGKTRRDATSNQGEGPAGAWPAGTVGHRPRLTPPSLRHAVTAAQGRGQGHAAWKRERSEESLLGGDGDGDGVHPFT